MKIIIENSLYSLLICILLIKDWEESIFILDQGAHNEILKEKVSRYYYYRDLSWKNNIILYYIEKIKLVIFFIRNKIFLNSQIIIYGDDIMLKYFFTKRKMYLVEDGTWTYQRKKKEKFIKSLLRFENPFYLPGGLDKNIEKIFLTGLASIPDEINDKVKIIDLKKLWEKKSKKEQNKIMEIFGINSENIEILRGKKKILFTQPLSEDGTLEEKEKIELYKRILNNYILDDLVIKVHPREKTEYKKIFAGVDILDKKIPSELFTLLDIKFDIAITIFSTSVFILNKDTGIHFYGTEVHPKIFKKFGSMNHIMSTNIYIKEEKNE